MSINKEEEEEVFVENELKCQIRANCINFISFITRFVSREQRRKKHHKSHIMNARSQQQHHRGSRGVRVY